MQVFEFVREVGEQVVGGSGAAHRIAHQSLDMRRFGERAKLQADDGLFEPASRLRNDSRIVGCRRIVHRWLVDCGAGKLPELRKRRLGRDGEPG